MSRFHDGLVILQRDHHHGWQALTGDDDWGIWAPCRTRRDQHTITVPAREIAYTDNTNIDQNIMYKQLWEIPNAFIPVQNYNHHKINTEYFNTQILPKCKHYIDVILG